MKKALYTGLVAMVLGAVLFPMLVLGQYTRRTESVVWNFVNGLEVAGVSVSSQVTGMPMDLVYCGQAAENGTIYLSPTAGVNGVDFGDGADYSISGTACDALDGATETTQDLVVFPERGFRVTGMYCQVAGTLGAAETVVFTYRAAAANVSPSLTCTVSVGQRGCVALAASATTVGSNVATAMQAAETSDNADDDLWCQVSILIQ